MSIQTYVPEDNLPNPVTTGTTIQAFTDAVAGEVWVAKNGVNSGTWRKAREVLHACVGRAAAFTATTAALFGWDTTINDAYGLFVGSPTYGFVVPVAGLYHLNAQFACTIPTLAEYGGNSIRGGPSGTTVITNENMIQNIANGTCNVRSLTNTYALAGDIFTMSFSASVSSTGVVGLNNRFFISYLGST